MKITKYSLNPLNIYDSDMSPNLLLMEKAIIIGLLLKGYIHGLSDHFLPLIPIFDYFGPPAVFEKVLQFLFALCSIGILFNVRVRACSIIFGLVLLVTTLSSMVSYRNSVVFCGFIFLMSGLHRKGETPWLVHYQIAILYFGAGLNKLLDADWRSGLFFENWMHAIIQSKIYLSAVDWFPPMMLAKMMSWTSIIVELLGAASLLTRTFIPLALSMLILFHTGAMVMTSGDFGIFTVAILVSFLSFVKWPSNQERSALTGIREKILYSPLFYMLLAVFLVETGSRFRSITAITLIALLYPYHKLKDWIKLQNMRY